MAVYLVLYFSVLIGYKFSRHVKQKTIIEVIVIIEAFLISSFRSFLIGADYFEYIRGNTAYEWGYRILKSIAHMIGGSYVYLAIVINFLIFCCLFWGYKKQIEKKYVMFAIMLWIFNPYGYIQSSFNILRQGCAMAVLLLGSQYLADCRSNIKGGKFKDYFMFLLLLICATGFHKSAWVFILLLPFTWINWRREFHILLLCICACINLVATNSSFMSLLARYFGFESYVSSWGGSIFDFPLYSIFIICFTGFLILRYDELFTDKKEKWHIDIYICSLCMLLLLVKNDQAYRLYVYLFYITIISVTIILKNVSDRLREIMQYGYVIYYSLMLWGFLYLQKVANNTCYYPFLFFWQTN